MSGNIGNIINEIVGYIKENSAFILKYICFTVIALILSVTVYIIINANKYIVKYELYSHNSYINTDMNFDYRYYYADDFYNYFPKNSNNYNDLTVFLSAMQSNSNYILIKYLIDDIKKTNDANLKEILPVFYKYYYYRKLNEFLLFDLSYYAKKISDYQKLSENLKYAIEADKTNIINDGAGMFEIIGNGFNTNDVEGIVRNAALMSKSQRNKYFNNLITGYNIQIEYFNKLITLHKNIMAVNEPLIGNSEISYDEFCSNIETNQMCRSYMSGYKMGLFNKSYNNNIERNSLILIVLMVLLISVFIFIEINNRKIVNKTIDKNKK